MSVLKSRDRWRAEVFVGGRRVASKSGFQKKSKAQTWHDETAARYRAGELVDTDLKTFDQLLERFERLHLPTVRPSSRTRYETDIEKRIRPFFCFLRLDQLKPELLEEFRRQVASQLTPKSANVCLALTRQMLARAVKWGALRRVPAGLESLAIPEVPYAWWSERRHVESFLEAAKASRYYPVYLTALLTGMRYGEIIGLGKADVDLDAGVIHVHRQWLEQEQKYGPPKHGKGRWLDFDPKGELGVVLSAAVSSAPSADIVFASRTGRHPARSKVAHKCFRIVQRNAGVPMLSFHGLRHTFASWYMREHDSVWDLKAILGHADIKTTQRYAHHSERQRRPMLSFGTHNSRTRVTLKVVGAEN